MPMPTYYRTHESPVWHTLPPHHPYTGHRAERRVFVGTHQRQRRSSGNSYPFSMRTIAVVQTDATGEALQALFDEASALMRQEMESALKALQSTLAEWQQAIQSFQ